MSVRPILLWPDPRLARPCDPIDPSAAADLVGDLLDTMYAAGGRGLAAPQIGVMARVFVVDVAWKDGDPSPMAFVNPLLHGTCTDNLRATEQCLSIPDLPMEVARPGGIVLEWQDCDGGRTSGHFDGILARCIQHELDHLDGVMILDHQTPEARVELDALYAG